MVHDFEEMWMDLKSTVLRNGDEYQVRLNGASSWEDYKHSQGMLEALRSVILHMQALELGIDAESEQENDHARIDG
jgi:hypothetical protein